MKENDAKTLEDRVKNLEENQKIEKEQEKNYEVLESILAFIAGYGFVLIGQYKKVCENETLEFHIIPPAVIFISYIFFFLFKKIQQKYQVTSKNDLVKMLLHLIVAFFIYWPISIALKYEYFESWDILGGSVVALLIIYLIEKMTDKKNGFNKILGNHKYNILTILPMFGFVVAFIIHVPFDVYDFKTNICKKPSSKVTSEQLNSFIQKVKLQCKEAISCDSTNIHCEDTNL